MRIPRPPSSSTEAPTDPQDPTPKIRRPSCRTATTSRLLPEPLQRADARQGASFDWSPRRRLRALPVEGLDDLGGKVADPDVAAAGGPTEDLEGFGLRHAVARHQHALRR